MGKRSFNKVLLVQPPFTIFRFEPKGADPPLGLAYIAAVLEREGYELQILDAVVEGFGHEESRENLITYGLTETEIEERIGAFSPDVVGVSCLFSAQAANAHNVCRIVKEADSNIVTVMGGAHPSALPELTLQDKNVDFVIIGEGEYSFRDLMRQLNGRRRYAEIDGIAYRENGSILVQPKTFYIENLDEIPFPARHLLPMEKYFGINRPHGTTKRRPNTSMITSRGCPASCVFCSIHTVWGRKFRARSPEDVLKEIEHLARDYGVKEVHFEDDNLTFDADRAREIFQGIIDRGLDIVWTTPNGVAAFTLREEMLPLMKESGCYKLYLAIESGDEEVLRRIIQKPLDLRKVKSLVQAIKKTGISVDAFFVVGFPGETREQIQKTFQFAREIDVENVFFFVATPYPGTELYKICRDGGYLVEDFCFENLRVGKASIQTPDFSPAELEKMVAKEMLGYRLRLTKHPVVFFKRVVLRFSKDPRFAMSYVLQIFRRPKAQS